MQARRGAARLERGYDCVGGAQAVQQLLARLLLRGPDAPWSWGNRPTRQAPDAVCLAQGVLKQPAPARNTLTAPVHKNAQ